LRNLDAHTTDKYYTIIEEHQTIINKL